MRRVGWLKGRRLGRSRVDMLLCVSKLMVWGVLRMGEGFYRDWDLVD